MGPDGKFHHTGGVLCLAPPTFVAFGAVARNLIGIQCQYASRYILGEGENTPILGDGLRFRNWPNSGGNYHSIEIHRDDVAEFVTRVQEFRRR